MIRSKKIRVAIGSAIVVLVALLFAADYLLESRWAIGGLAMLLGAAGWIEFARLSGIAAGSRWTHRGIAVAGGLAAGAFLLAAALAPESLTTVTIVSVLVAFLALAFLLAIVEAEPEETFPRIVAGLLGIVLFGLFYSYVLRVYFFAETPGEALVRGAVFFLGVKGTDIAAYLVGSSIGRIRFLKISPGKTLEGYGAALLWGAVWFTACGAVFPDHLFRWFDGILLGILLAAASCLGDLTESLIKRYYRVKDSGALLPEFGGVLDLIDSFIFSAFLFWAFLA